MYCVLWKTRKASPARKSRDERSPATGRKVNPVHSNEYRKNVWNNNQQLLQLFLLDYAMKITILWVVAGKEQKTIECDTN